MRRRRGLPEPIGDQVRRELARFGPAGAIRELVAAWPDAVGAPIAANAWPTRVARDGTLHVATSSSTWAFELTRCADVVLGRLAERLGDLAPRSLRFAVGLVPERERDDVETSAWTVPNVQPEHRERAERIACEIADSDLRALVARAVAASLAGDSEPPAGRLV